MADIAINRNFDVDKEDWKYVKIKTTLLGGAVAVLEKPGFLFKKKRHLTISRIERDLKGLNMIERLQPYFGFAPAEARRPQGDYAAALEDARRAFNRI